MRRAVALLLLVCTVACQSRTEQAAEQARSLYRTAWEKKLAGDPVGAKRLLQELAQRFPQTRAGKHARRVLAPAPTSDDVPIGVGALFGAVAGIVIPTLIDQAYGENAMLKATLARMRRRR